MGSLEFQTLGLCTRLVQSNFGPYMLRSTGGVNDTLQMMVITSLPPVCYHCLSAADILGIAGGGSNPVLKLRSDWYLESVQVLHPFQSSAAYFFFHNGWLKHKRGQKDVRYPRCLFVACLHGAAVVYVWKNQSHLDAFGHAHITFGQLMFGMHTAYLADLLPNES
jgi:hypothetical protein